MSLDRNQTDENTDMETQPLLSHQNDVNVEGRWGFHRKKQLPWWKKYWPMFVGFTTGFITVLVLVMVALKLHKNIPSNDELQATIFQISDIEIEKVHLDGWRQVSWDNLQHENPKQKREKYLQVSCTLQTSLNYDLLVDDSTETSFTETQASWFRFINENIVQTVCIDVNNMTTFNNNKKNNNSLNLGSLFIMEPFCLDLHNGTINTVKMTVLIKPEIKNAIRIMKRIWNHQYNDLNMWSILDITLAKHLPFFDITVPFINLQNIKVNWNKILHWDEISQEVDLFRDFFPEDLDLQSIQMVDTLEGFDIQLETNEFPNKWMEYIHEKLPWLHLGDDTLLPEINWYVKLSDCNNNYRISLPDVTSYTDNIDFIKDYITPKMNVELRGSLPDSLLNDVCYSDGENVVTPLTKFLNSLFNNTEYVEVEIYGQTKDNNETITANANNSLLPHDVLNDILDGIEYFPVRQNITFNISNMIEDFIIDDMQLKWESGKFSVVGTVNGLLNLSFYQTESERFQVNNIKGNLELYHNDKHFISLPMKTWIPSESKIIHDESNGNATMLEITFNVDDRDMTILNRFELSKCFNEILFKGETMIKFDSVLDIAIESLLGEIMVTGLITNGETVVH